MPSNNSYLKGIAKRIVEGSFYDKETNTLFATNVGISPEVLRGLAKRNNFRIGQTKSGDYISIPLSMPQSAVADTFVSMYDTFMDSYTYYNQNFNSLLTAYRTFDLMEENLGEVDLILDTYVAEVLSTGFIENPLEIKINNEKALDFVEKVLYKNKIYQRLPVITKGLAKYGNYGLLLYYPYLEKNRDNPEVDLGRIDVLKDLDIKFVNPKYFKVNCDEDLNPINYETDIDNAFVVTNQSQAIRHKIWQPWQFVHGLIYDDDTAPYGKSMLWSMRSAFDQLSTLESLLAVSRASKIQRLVISVPMPPNIGVIDSYQFINEIKGNINNSLFTNAPGVRAGKKIPAATEILYKPAIEGFDIDKIEANIDLSSTEDVEYFLDKILRNSKLPKGYLVGDDTITTSQTLESQDLKLQRTLIPLRDALVNMMTYLVHCILTHGGWDVSKLEVEVLLKKPIQVSSDQIAKYVDTVELLKGMREITGGVPMMNQFQILIELGMPETLAMLICSNNNISLIKDKEILRKFLRAQTVNKSEDTKDLENIPKVDTETESESIIISRMTGKKFLMENYDLAESLKEFTQIRSGKAKQDKVLTESLLASEEKIIPNK